MFRTHTHTHTPPGNVFIYLLMMTAPLYMTEKVGMLTFSGRKVGRSVGPSELAQLSAFSQQPHAGVSAQTGSL